MYSVSLESRSLEETHEREATSARRSSTDRFCGMKDDCDLWIILKHVTRLYQVLNCNILIPAQAFFVVNYLDGTLPFPNVDLVERCAEVDDGHVPRECGEEQELGGNACTSSSSSSSSCPTASDLAEASSHSTRMREMRNSGDLQGTESELWAAMHEQVSISPSPLALWCNVVYCGVMWCNVV